MYYSFPTLNSVIRIFKIRYRSQSCDDSYTLCNFGARSFEEVYHLFSSRWRECQLEWVIYKIIKLRVKSFCETYTNTFLLAYLRILNIPIVIFSENIKQDGKLYVFYFKVLWYFTQYNWKIVIAGFIKVSWENF